MKRFLAIIYLSCILLLPLGISTTAFASPASSYSNPKQNLMYILLVAETALQNRQLDIALKHYLKAMRLSNDPLVARQATQIAIQSQNASAAFEAATRWATLDSNNLQAQMVACTLLFSESQEAAEPFLTRAITLDSGEVLQSLPEIQMRLTDPSIQNLIGALRAIAEKNPKNAYILLIAAQSTSQQENISEANQWVDAALKINPNFTSALQLKARLIRYVHPTDKEALAFLDKKVDEFQDNMELRLFYANALLDANQITNAKHHLLKVADNSTYGGQALLLLGEIEYRNQDLNSAIPYLEKAAKIENSQINAAYLLGQIAEQSNHLNQAIDWYSKVTSGPYHIPSFLQAALLLADSGKYTEALNLLEHSAPETTEEQKQILLTEFDILMANKKPEQALDLSNNMLHSLPEDIDILFAHSLAATKLNRYGIVEEDLRKILDQDPNHANALNALGYVLTVQNQQLKEAHIYLTRAIELSPNNPFFMDSMGWLQYRLGDLKQAVFYLKKAGELSDDGDIAAHLGEVLWASGDRNAAMTVWNTALIKAPQNNTILNTMRRLGISTTQ